MAYESEVEVRRWSGNSDSNSNSTARTAVTVGIDEKRLSLGSVSRQRSKVASRCGATSRVFVGAWFVSIQCFSHDVSMSDSTLSIMKEGGVAFCFELHRIALHFLAGQRGTAALIFRAQFFYLLLTSRNL